LEDIHTLFPEESKSTAGGVLFHQCGNLSHGYITVFRDAVDLIIGGGDTDIRVKTAAGRSHKVDRDRKFIIRVDSFQGVDTRLYFILQGRIFRAEIGTRGRGGIIRHR